MFSPFEDDLMKYIPYDINVLIRDLSKAGCLLGEGYGYRAQFYGETALGTHKFQGTECVFI